MFTTFILHGGQTSTKSVSNTLFFKEIVSGLKHNDRVLFIGFGRADDKILSTYLRDKKMLLAQTTVKIEVVSATHRDLLEQMKTASVVYIPGGDTRKLLAELKQHPYFTSLLAGKVVAGSSAGANVFATFCFSTNLKGIYKGLGALPFSLVCHYGNKELGADEAAVTLLSQHSKELEIVTLPEQMFQIFKVDTTKNKVRKFIGVI
jgi:peptidase E